MPLRTHRFGSASIIPKISDIKNKCRPLGSYYRNAAHNILSASCRLIIHGIKDIYKHHGLRCVAVDSVRKVRDCFHHQNVWCDDLRSRGYEVLSTVAKFDIDGFYNRVEWSLLYRALDWWLESVQLALRRRTGYALPRARGSRVTPAVYTRSFGSCLRNSAFDEESRGIYPVTGRRVAHCYAYMTFSDVVSAVRFDLSHASWARFGGSLFRIKDVGLTQGSPCAPGACTLCCCYLEFRGSSLLIASARLARGVVQRWVDDIYVVHSCAVAVSLRDRDAAHRLSSEYVAGVRGLYTEDFKLKTEDLSGFVGFSVGISDVGAYSLSPLLSAGKVRLQHACAAKPARMLIGVLVGQFCAISDRMLNSDFAGALAHFLGHCKDLGYSHRLLAAAAVKFTNRHPYLRKIVATAFLQSGLPIFNV